MLIDLMLPSLSAASSWSAQGPAWKRLEREATFGRRRKMAPQDVSTAKRLLAKGDADENAATVAKRLGVSRRTLFRNLREQRDREQVRQEAAE